MKIAIIVGIGSGKSAVVSILKENGIEVVDCDVIAHRLTVVDGLTGVDGLAMPYIYSEFGPDFILPNGNMDRKKMRELVFNNPREMEKLNNIMQPLIMKVALASTYDKIQIYDIPLLAQSPEWLAIIDYIIVIDVPEEVQIERVMARNGYAREIVMKIMDRQSTRQARLVIADYVVDNSGDLEYLRNQIVPIVEKIFALIK